MKREQNVGTTDRWIRMIGGALAALGGLVLLDLLLPAVSGLEVSHQVHATPETTSLPVILLCLIAVSTRLQRMFLGRFMGYAHLVVHPVDIRRVQS